MKHSIKEIKEKNQTRVTVTQRGGGRGGGVLIKVLYEEAPPQGPTPYPLYVPFYTEKVPLLYTL